MLVFGDLTRFFIAEWRVLSFGLIFQFLSSFGRTFYIALFGGEVQADFGLTPGEFSYIYSAATLTAAMLIPWLGRLVDDISIRTYAVLMVSVLAVSALSFAAASHVAVLFLALFGFRATGGSMMNHASVVTMSRYFVRRRGIATSICALGIAIGEAVLPILAVVMMGVIGWRMTWMGSGALLLFVGVPLLLWLLWPTPLDAKAREETADAAPETDIRHATRREALTDLKFYALAPTLVLPSPLITALFFHHGTIAAVKGWTLEWLAACFVGFAMATIVAAVVFGMLVDRYSARRMLPWSTVPMIAGLVCLVYGNSPAAALLYLLGVGMTTGGRFSLSGAIWAEIYGTRHLGGIRSVVHTVTALLFGISPAAFGWLIDQDVSIDAVVLAFVYLLLASMLAAAFATGRRR
ncbi:MAG: MFS transporter [Rhodospirillales bacterium]